MFEAVKKLLLSQQRVSKQEEYSGEFDYCSRSNMVAHQPTPSNSLPDLRMDKAAEAVQEKMSEYPRPPGTGDMDSSTLDIYECVKELTMTSLERVFALVEAVRYIVRANIPGALVECGVWKGGSI